MADNMAQMENQGHQAGKKPAKMDFAGLNEYLKIVRPGKGSGSGQVQAAQPQGGVNSGAQPTSPSSASVNQPTVADPISEGGNPDVVAAQEDFKGIKDGDSYTDKNGVKWVWSAFDFTVLPEKRKDEEVDEIEGADVEVDSEESSDSAAYDENLDRALEVALSVLNEEDGEDDNSDNAVSKDNARDIVMDAVDDVLSGQAFDEEGEGDGGGEGYKDAKPLTPKRAKEGWYTTNKSEIAPYMWNLKRVKEIGKDPKGNTIYHVDPYGAYPNQAARNKARQSSRRPVAATWEDCKAKDKARCPYHGAAFMTDQLSQALKANGVTAARFGVVMNEGDIDMAGKGKKAPMMYRMLFAVPEDVSPDVRKKIAKDFFMRNPNVLFDSKDESDRYGSQVNFSMTAGDDPDDIPVDAPSDEELANRVMTRSEAQWGEQNYIYGAMSWTKCDVLSMSTIFDMLSERPTNIVETNEDFLRYAKQCPDLFTGKEMEEFERLHSDFLKVNANKKGLQSFLLNGEITEMADGLAEAAQKGLEKEGEAYYSTAEKVYDTAADVFNRVQDMLMDQFAAIRSESEDLPEPNKVNGGIGRGGHRYMTYLGENYTARGSLFPFKLKNLKMQQEMEDLGNIYAQRFLRINASISYIKDGCKRREPLIVMEGLESLKASLEETRAIKDAIGKFQDAIVESNGAKWRNENHFKAKGEKKTSDNAPKGNVDEAKKENTEGQETIEKPDEKKPVLKKKKLNKAVNKESSGDKEQKKDGVVNQQETASVPAPAPAEPAPAQEQKQKSEQTDNTADTKKTETKSDTKDAGKEKGQKDTQKKTKSTAEAATQKSTKGQNESIAKLSGTDGVSMVQGIEVPFKPTIEDANRINKTFANLEKRMRGLSHIVSTQTEDSDEWQAADKELRDVKDAIDRLIRESRGKGYMWTKDPETDVIDGRPKGVPKNFHVISIKDASGKSVNIPYNPPTASEMEIPKIVSEATGGERANSETDTGAGTGTKKNEPFQRKASYSVDFDNIRDKIGSIGGVYGDQDVSDLILDGYKVFDQYEHGKKVYYLGKPQEDDKSRIDISDEHPALRLNAYFVKKMGGDPKDENGLKHFVAAFRWKARKMDED